jgi:hypothetical protein
MIWLPKGGGHPVLAFFGLGKKLSLMSLQKHLKTEIGLLSQAFNQTVIPLNTAEDGFLRPRHP